MPHYLVNFVHFRNTLKKAQIIGICYAFSHAFVYFAYAVGFRFGTYLIQAGRMTTQPVFGNIIIQKSQASLLLDYSDAIFIGWEINTML